MERYRTLFTRAVWAAAAIFGATRLAVDKALMLGLIKTLMVLIAAFGQPRDKAATGSRPFICF